ncbi:MAG: GerMN domain-containing protein [Clostridia bacterium]|nr:GerMN domain-containing protein [Clostridia bacterium]
MKRLILLLTALTLLLSSCAAQPAASVRYEALSPAENPYDAPTDDSGLAYTASAALHLPNRSGQRLIVQYVPLELRYDVHPARTILEALLSFPTNDDVRALNYGTVATLALHSRNPVEIAGGVCTVNLASSALQLSYSNLYTVCLSIAATMTELPDVDAVNILIADQAVAMDITGSLPLGTISAIPGGELPVLWEQMDARRPPLGESPSGTPVSATVTLYFPLEDGSGFVPETRSLSFPGQDPRQLALVLVNALSDGAQYVSGAARMPSLGRLLNVDPIVNDLEDGGRMLTLRFNAGLEETLQLEGLDPTVFLGAVHRTLVTFIPSVSRVHIYSGDTLLDGLYSPIHGSTLFPDGLISRHHFSGCLMNQVTLYFSDGSLLTPVLRAVPHDECASLRALVTELMAGPDADESARGLVSALPQDLGSADVLGLALKDGTLLVNLSGNFAQAVSASDKNETLLCYSLVNTLCDAAQVDRVRFYFEGDMPGSLSGDIYWGGEFLRNPGLIR